MTQPNDGGPAFPRPASQHSGPQEGMSLRDWFAGKALASMQTDGWTLQSMSGLARRAYAIADAMLKARSQDGE